MSTDIRTILHTRELNNDHTIEQKYRMCRKTWLDDDHFCSTVYTDLSPFVCIKRDGHASVTCHICVLHSTRFPTSTKVLS